MRTRQRVAGTETPHCRSPGGGPSDGQTGSQAAGEALPAAPHGHGNAPERDDTDSDQNLMSDDITATVGTGVLP